MKKLATCIALFGIAAGALAQNPVIEKAIRDPNRKANEAKADKKIMESNKNTLIASNDTTAVKQKTALKIKKKCAAKRKKKSS